jgi:hypothetical protein
MTYIHSKSGRQISPLAGTIFEKSTTPLSLWFYAIFMFSTSKNGVSAKELQRQLGVTYKTAWRMASQIRKLMEQGKDPLDGIIEADETYIHGTPILGAVKRGGAVRMKTTPNRKSEQVAPFIIENVAAGATLVTDNAPVYMAINHVQHHPVHHKKFQKGGYAPTTMEAIWGNLKRSLAGTHHYVSAKHLQSYLDFFAFQYEYRASEVPPFLALLGRACQCLGARA